MATLTLTSAEVEGLVDWDELFEALTRAHCELSAGEAVQLAPHALYLSNDRAHDAPTVVPMAAFAPSLGLFGLKVLADSPRNRAEGLPAQRSSISVFDAGTGECVGVVDGRSLTRMRTAAVTAVATRSLARADSRVLCLLGAGALAIEHAAVLSRLFDFDEVRLWSRSPERSRDGVRKLREAGLPATSKVSVAEAVEGADIVCTLTPSSEPILFGAQIVEGVHVNAVGSPPRSAFSELHPDVFQRATAVVVDERSVALADSGNIRNACDANALAPSALVELGKVLSAPASGRVYASDITVYNSVGIGLQDLAAADHVLGRARTLGTGTMVCIRE